MSFRYEGGYLGSSRRGALIALGVSEYPTFEAHGYAFVEGSTGRLVRLRGTSMEAARFEARGARGAWGVLCKAEARVGGLTLYRDLEEIYKAMDPLTKRGFSAIIKEVTKALENATAEKELAALRELLDRIDIDWYKLDRGGVDAAAKAIRQGISEAPRRFIRLADHAFEDKARGIVIATKRGANKKYKTGVKASLNQTDEKMVDWLGHSQSNFIMDEYGRRALTVEAEVRDIVSRGIAEGLGRKELGKQISNSVSAGFLAKSEHYWTIVAAAFVGRARSYGLLSSFDDAGIELYRISAVLDERTSDICRYMDGKIFKTGASLSKFTELESVEDPLEIKHSAPYMHMRNVDGKHEIYIKTGEQKSLTVAEVLRSGVGIKDDPGSFRGKLGMEEMVEAGVGPPPYHCLCRTTMVPEF